MKQFKAGDRVLSIKWGKQVEGQYIGLAGTVVELSNDLIRVKLDADPVPEAANCPFWPSELVHIKEKVGATN